MIYFYWILSAVLVVVYDGFFGLFTHSYAWWLTPLLLVGFFLALSIIHLLWFVLTFACVSLKSDKEKGARYYRFVLKASLPLIVGLARVKINLSGKAVDELPTDEPLFFVCNHQHHFDPAIIWSVFPDNNIGFIGKKEIYTTMPFIAKVMHKLYGLPIDRDNNREAVRTIIEAANFLKAKKASMLIFPEGYTNKTDELLPFRNGAFKIALKSKVPIVICALYGTRKIPKTMVWRGCEVEFCIADVIQPEEYEGMNTNEIGEIVHEKMQNALDELREKQK